MDSVSREKRKRIDNHAVRRTAPAPPEATEHVGQSGLPSPAQALHQLQQLPLQHYCDSCKTLCAAQEHAEGAELPTSMHCPACGSIALPIDPNVVRKTSLQWVPAMHRLVVPCRIFCSISKISSDGFEMTINAVKVAGTPMHLNGKSAVPLSL